MTSIENHRILNCGDMKKDGKENPNIVNYGIFKSSSSLITGKDCSKLEPLFKELKEEINSTLLEQVKKYCYASLLPIPEKDEYDEELYQNITLINKNNRQVVPDSVIYAFIDAGMEPKKYFRVEKDKILICETPASNIDPGYRENNQLFYPKIESKYSLETYGFSNGSAFNYYPSKNKVIGGDEYKYIEIVLDSNNLFRGLIDRKGNIGDTYEIILNSKPYTNTNPGSYDNVIQILFKGNNEKNTYITNNSNNQNNEVKKICTLLIFFKELGDTMQPIILIDLINKLNMFNIRNSCLLTIDTILACRSKIINVPYLLSSNSIITYYNPLPEEEYEKLMKDSEINKTLLNNNFALQDYEEFLQKIRPEKKNRRGKDIPKKITFERTEITVSEPVIKRFTLIKDSIIEANNFINKIKEQLDSDNEIKDKVKINLQKNSYKEITNLPLIQFKKIIRSLNAQTLFIMKGKKRMIQTNNFKVFPEKLIMKNVYYNWGEYEEIIDFSSGILNFMQKSQYQIGGVDNLDSDEEMQEAPDEPTDDEDYMSNETDLVNLEESNISFVGDDEDDQKLYVYSLLYPYIYCNPYLLRMILTKKDNELIDFLKNMLNNIFSSDDFVVPKKPPSQEEINNLYLTDLYYYLDNELPNMETEIDNYKIYTNRLLEQIQYYIENVNLDEPKTPLLKKTRKTVDSPVKELYDEPDEIPLEPAPKKTKSRVYGIYELDGGKKIKKTKKIKATKKSKKLKKTKKVKKVKEPKKTKNKKTKNPKKQKTKKQRIQKN